MGGANADSPAALFFLKFLAHLEIISNRYRFCEAWGCHTLVVTESKRGSPGLCQKRAVITVPLWPPLYSGRRGCAALMEEKGSVEQGEGRTGYEKNTPGPRWGRQGWPLGAGARPAQPGTTAGVPGGAQELVLSPPEGGQPQPLPSLLREQPGGQGESRLLPWQSCGPETARGAPARPPARLQAPGGRAGLPPLGLARDTTLQGSTSPARLGNASSSSASPPEPLCPWPWAPAPGPARWLTDLRHEPPFSPSPLTCHTDTTVPTRWSWCDHA